jgi:hypothetical protein
MQNSQFPTVSRKIELQTPKECRIHHIAQIQNQMISSYLVISKKAPRDIVHYEQ